MKKVRAKFYVVSVTNEYGTETVTMSAVYDSKNNTENNQFSEATPWGELKMLVSNKEAQGFLELGKEYYLDFIKAE